MESSSDSLIPPAERSPKPQQDHWLRWLKYLLVGAICNGAVWMLALSYLKKTPPTYTSTLVIHVAGSSPGVSVNLPDIGQANTSSGTAFGSHSDPRENYKLMMTSETILNIAAKALNLSPKEFGKPNVSLIDNTTLLEVNTKGKQPQLAQDKSQALYQALDKRLQELRQEEQLKRDRAVQNALLDAKEKLTAAQNKLSQYKLRSGLNSTGRVKKLIDNIATLQIQQIETVAQHRRISDRLAQLSATLGLTPQKAANALVLATDREFQKILSQYTDANATLLQLRSHRGENYPDVVKARREKEAVLKALLQRGEILLGVPLKQLNLELLILDNSNGSGEKRANLFVQLVDLQAEQQGLAGQMANLQEQIKRLENQLSILTQKESVLDSLDRDLQIAQAVFASTLTKIDLSKSDPFASFPMMQIIEHPTLPTEPSAPKPKLVLAGAVFGSLLVSMGLTILWWREPMVKISKNVMRHIIE